LRNWFYTYCQDFSLQTFGSISVHQGPFLEQATAPDSYETRQHIQCDRALVIATFRRSKRQCICHRSMLPSCITLILLHLSILCRISYLFLFLMLLIWIKFISKCMFQLIMHIYTKKRNHVDNYNLNFLKDNEFSVVQVF